ncbi:hypothetical protein ACS0TY_015143 [Phlomoides rotata]
MNNSFMNLSAFSKILKKYEKITSRTVARSYMKIVEDSYIGSSEEVASILWDTYGFPLDLTQGGRS